jgi:hypothetical protein
MSTRKLKSQRGIAAVIAVLMIGVMTMIGLAAMSTSNDEVSIAGNELREARAFYAADAGLNTAVANIQSQFDATGKPPDSLPSGTLYLNGTKVSYLVKDMGPAAKGKVLTGSHSGMQAVVKNYTVQSDAEGDGSTKMTTSMQLQLMNIPIVEFGVFYQNELLLSPAFAWTVTGRVHTNAHAWLQASANLNMANNITASGSIYHGLPNGQFSGTATSDVNFKDASGSYLSMKVGSAWLDANDANWYSSASSRWSGRVRDLAFGEKPLRLALSGTNDAHKYIEREAGNSNSYEARASLKFIDNQAYQLVGGVWNNITAGMTADGVISYGADRFYDERQAKWVDVLDLDINLLDNKGYNPTNGIIYFSSTVGDYPALRLINGSTFGVNMTIASRNPMYTVGNINSSSKKPVAFICDGFTALSSSWNDANSSQPKAVRSTNVNTTIQAAIIAGDLQWTAANYQGGLENLVSLLESWNSAKTLTINGSFACLYHSQQAIGAFATTYYDPPKRAFAYDVEFDDLSNHPPSVPSTVSLTIANWSQQHVGL